MPVTLNNGTLLYKGVSTEQMAQKDKGGIENYKTTFSELELGPGFYLSTDKKMAQIYTEGKVRATGQPAFLLTFKLQGDALGEELESGWEKHKNIAATHSNYDFVKVTNDYNFHTAHGQKKLTLNGKEEIRP